MLLINIANYSMNKIILKTVFEFCYIPELVKQNQNFNLFYSLV